MLIIEQPLVLDDFLPTQYQDLIEKQMLSEEVNWHFMRDITYDIEKFDQLNMKTSRPAFAHKFYDRQRGVISPAYGLVTPIVYFACEKVKFHVSEIIAARSFLTIPLPNLENNIDHPHVDREVTHLVVLYYANDADGDTVFYDKTFRDVSPSELNPKELNVMLAVSPKKGRAVIFDGSIYHASTRPTKNQRVVINFGVW